MKTLRYSLVFCALAVASYAQTINGSNTVRIPGSVHLHATPANDTGRARGDLPMDRMLLVLKGSPAQNAALEKLLADQRDPASPMYQKWLSPQEFGAQFGPSPADIATVTDWLTQQGFHVTEIANGQRSIEFSGTSGQVERAFRTEMHHYSVRGERHLANSTDIAIPASLARIVSGVASLNDFHPIPMHHTVPSLDLSNGGHAMGPGDFATIYNVNPLWNANTDGTGQTIAVVGRTNFNMSDVASFRTMFGLPGNNTQVVLNGRDPGIVNQNEEVEALLDTQWSGAVAKGATVKFVLSANTSSTGGDVLSSQYIVSNKVGSVLTTSFGLCESQMGSENQFFSSLWQQAAAEGISVVAAAGDSGSAGCDAPSATTGATQGLGVSGIASTPYNVAVGGTQFNENGANAAYWSPTNSATYSSALSYIPETVWNESSWALGNSGNNLFAGSGGISGQYAAPAWQTGAGVPSSDPGNATQHHRYIPDVSLSGAGHDAYIVMLNGGLIGVGGTSAAAPSFAGILAMRNQHGGGSIGNAAPGLYSLAAQFPTAFHDVVTGTNAVPCSAGSPACLGGTSGTAAGTMSGWSAGPGYDLATGLGSVDAYKLVMNWPSAAPVAPVVTSVAPNPLTGSTTAQTITINGSGFQAGSTLSVIVGFPGSSNTLQGGQVTFVSSSQLQVAFTFGTTARVWTVQVVNPNGQASGTASLTVNAPVFAPAITSLNPSTVVGSTAYQTVTINGSNFQSGLQVQAGYSSGSLQGSVVSVTPTAIQLSLLLGTAARTITFQIVNPDGQKSGTATLNIVAPVTAPVITGLSSSTLARSTRSSSVLLYGTGFENGAVVQMTWAATNAVVNPYTFVLSANRLQISGAIAANPGTWNIQVLNPDGGVSNTVQIVVR